MPGTSQGRPTAAGHRPPEAAWPPGFARVPAEPWTEKPVDPSAIEYDGVDRQGWYANLDPTVHEILRRLPEGGLLLDYSGGTGILVGRLLRQAPGLRARLAIVDASPKFLRLALEKFRADGRVALRLLPFDKGLDRLRTLPEVAPELTGQVDVLACTNAIHLYPDLPPVVAAWHQALRPGGRVLAQSGNVRWPAAGAASKPWIIDETVAAVRRACQGIVRSEPRFSPYRAALDDAERMRRHDDLNRRYFLPPRDLEEYLAAFRAAGLVDVQAEARRFTARTSDWLAFLSVYHEGILGWVGGVERIDGRAATPAEVADRLDLLRRGLDAALGGRPSFEAAWTYISARKPD